jgi:hypothetical protein
MGYSVLEPYETSLKAGHYIGKEGGQDAIR